MKKYFFIFTLKKNWRKFLASPKIQNTKYIFTLFLTLITNLVTALLPYIRPTLYQVWWVFLVFFSWVQVFFLINLLHKITYTTVCIGASLVVQFIEQDECGKAFICQWRRHRFNPWSGKIPLGKEVAAHSTILAWEIPWREEPGGLLSMGLQRVGHDLVAGQQHQQSTLSLQTFSQTRDLICGVQMLIQRLGSLSLQTNHAESCHMSKYVTWICFPESSRAASRDLLCPDEVKHFLLHTGLSWYPLYHQNLGTILDINPRSSLFFSPTVFNWPRIPRYKTQRKYPYPNYIGFKVLFLVMSISVLFLLLSIQ